MNRFWRSFIPYQLWRFAVLNVKMYLVAKGIVGPHGRRSARRAVPPAAPSAPTHRTA